MKLLKKLTCTLLTAMMLCTTFISPVCAAESQIQEVDIINASVTGFSSGSYNNMSRATTFIDTTITVTYIADGMYVTITTDMNKTASAVGVKDVEIQRKDGNSWTTIAVSDGGGVTNQTGCLVSFTYPNVEYGETYRVVCTHYANVDEYRELYHETAGFKCLYEY